MYSLVSARYNIGKGRRQNRYKYVSPPVDRPFSAPFPSRSEASLVIISTAFSSITLTSSLPRTVLSFTADAINSGSMESFTTFLPSTPFASNYAMNFQSGADLNYAGLALANRGDYVGAERTHRQALEQKLATIGPDNISTAVSYNALGEALMHLGQLDEAEENIKKALGVAIRFQSRSDEGFYRENLAMVYEYKGDLQKARNTRLTNDPDKYVCSYYKVCNIFPRRGSICVFINYL